MCVKGLEVCLVYHKYSKMVTLIVILSGPPPDGSDLYWKSEVLQKDLAPHFSSGSWASHLPGPSYHQWVDSSARALDPLLWAELTPLNEGCGRTKLWGQATRQVGQRGGG